MEEPDSEPSAGREPNEQFTHSEDFRSICWRGRQYSLTSNQALVVQELYEALENGQLEVSQAILADRLGNEGARIRELFKRSGLWGPDGLVDSGRRRGMYRLHL
jgi:hypothetical protein